MNDQDSFHRSSCAFGFCCTVIEASYGSDFSGASDVSAEIEDLSMQVGICFLAFVLQYVTQRDAFPSIQSSEGIYLICDSEVSCLSELAIPGVLGVSHNMNADEKTQLGKLPNDLDFLYQSLQRGPRL
jgi:hypothetical protein